MQKSVTSSTALATALGGISLLSGMILTTSCLATPQSNLAMPHRFYIAVGGYSIIRTDTTLSLTESNLGAGVSISPSDTLGLDFESTVFKIDGNYRFTPTSQVAFSWYRIDSDADRRLDTEISWLDDSGNEIAIAAGSQVVSSFTYDIMSLGYNWSFYHNNKVELSLGAGLHATQFEIGLQVLSDANGVPVSQSTRNVATTVPLPVLGLGIHYRVTPKLLWYVTSSGFYMTFDEWEGFFSETEIGMEYNLWRNLGVGVGLASDRLNVTETTPEYKFNYENHFNGINLYLSAAF